MIKISILFSEEQMYKWQGVEGGGWKNYIEWGETR